MSARPSTRLTYDDYLELPDDGKRYEIIDGELFVTPAPTPDHQRASGRLHLALADWVRSHPPAEVFYAPIDLILADDTIVQPDLLVVLNPAVVTKRGIEAAPGLVVEILSPSTAKRDRGLKRGRYARSSVTEYWVVDADERVVEQYVLDARGELARHALARDEDRIASVALHGLLLEVCSVFAHR
ncbi:MAG: Uma2 family endonuclease [Planctomycetota bacterium]